MVHGPVMVGAAIVHIHAWVMQRGSAIPLLRGGPPRHGLLTREEEKRRRIALGRNERCLTLVVEDDGKGFEPAKIIAHPDAGRRPGILSMPERLDLVAGTLIIIAKLKNTNSDAPARTLV